MSQAHSRATGKREQNWFAVTCWNIGSRCWNAKKYDLCGRFLRLASEVYGNIDSGESAENKMMMCMSLILSVIARWLWRSKKKSTLTETQVKLAAELLVRAGKMVNIVSWSQNSSSDGN